MPDLEVATVVFFKKGDIRAYRTEFMFNYISSFVSRGQGDFMLLPDNIGIGLWNINTIAKVEVMKIDSLQFTELKVKLNS